MSNNFHAPDDRLINFDNRLDSYQGFLDYPWVNSFLNIVYGTKLNNLALDLCMDWKSISNTFRLPWFVVTTLESFHDGYTTAPPPSSQYVVEAFCKLVNDEPQIPHEVKARITTKVEQAVSAVKEHMTLNPLKFERQNVWSFFIENKEFALSIWGSQRICFSALLHSYEDFLSRCVSVATDNPNYRSRTIADLRADLDRHTQNGIGEICLGGDEINIARLVRNSLAHKGGRVTDELSTMQHNFPITSDGRIHVMPEHVRILFALLSTRLTQLVLRIATLPAYVGKVQ